MNKNQEYERFTTRLYKTLTRMHPEVTVNHNQVIGGNQIDVSWTHWFAGVEYLTIVECKNYNTSVDLNCFRQLAYNMNALKARGVLVTTVGFQSGVIEAAKSQGDVTLLKVNFEIEKNAATLNFGVSNITNVQYKFDEYTTTQQQFDTLRGLFQNGQAENLTVFGEGYDETITLGEHRKHLDAGVADGVHKIPLESIYVRLPMPMNEAVRIASVTYEVSSINFNSFLGTTLSADVVTANVVNELTNEEYAVVIDDYF